MWTGASPLTERAPDDRARRRALHVVHAPRPPVVERTKIGRTGQRIVAKIMGLITCVMGVQFIINGITPVAVQILKSAR